MKVNLEKELIRQNRRIATPENLLLLQEYDRLGVEIADSEILSRLGINGAVKEGKKLQQGIDDRIRETQKFNQERVFHISQIEALCKKYHLRFLSARLYMGSIDRVLPVKISQFEIAHNINCNKENSFIVAPKKSFKLEQSPKDPILFYKINDEFFYMIHKWGNDLSLTRRLFPLLSTNWFSVLLIMSCAGLLCLFWSLVIKGEQALSACLGVTIMVPAIICFVAFSDIRFVSRNVWNSQYED